jgi:hypothetical protein
VVNSAGYNDINNICKSDKRHRHSDNHIACLNNGIEFSLSSQYKQSIEKHNEAVKKNRKIVGQFIRAVCLLGSREHDGNGASINGGSYIEVLNMLAPYNSDLHNPLEMSSTVFRGSSPNIQNKLIDSVSELTTMEFKMEISKSNFASLIIDETSDVMMKCQLSSVLRYVTAGGKVEERFLRFTDVSSDRAANPLFKHAVEILNDFECGPKLIAQTYYCAAVMASQQGGIQAKNCEQYCSGSVKPLC